MSEFFVLISGAFSTCIGDIIHYAWIIISLADYNIIECSKEQKMLNLKHCRVKLNKWNDIVTRHKNEVKSESMQWATFRSSIEKLFPWSIVIKAFDEMFFLYCFNCLLNRFVQNEIYFFLHFDSSIDTMLHNR